MAVTHPISYELKCEFGVLLGPLGNRHRSPDQQDVVIRARPITGHNVLEMQAEELPSDAAVVFGQEHVPERDAPGHEVASGSAAVDADALEGVTF